VNRNGLFLGALLLSALFHGAGVWFFSGASFVPLADSFKAVRKWTKDVPAMHVEALAGDPLLAERDATGRPAAAPVQEREADRVNRLSEDPAQTAPGLSAAAVSAPRTETALPAPDVPEAPAFVPRADVIARTDPKADDAAAPQRVLPQMPRAVSAPDVAPPQELLATAPASSGRNAPPAATGAAFGTGGADDLLAPPPLPAPAAFGTGGLPRAPEPTAPAEKTAQAAPPAPAPAAVMPTVETAAVTAEKTAVRELRDRTEDVRPFAKNVRCSLDHWVDPARPTFKYFRVRVSSRAEEPLPVVAKDVVYLIDISGSIGSERLRACSAAIAEQVKTLNPGDRFNVAAFRGTFSYAFDRWMAADSVATDVAAKWVSRLKAGGATDVFATLRSVLALPRDPARPMIALVITDGEATQGVTRSAEIISAFTELNGGLVSVYMYGVKENANAYLMDMLARGNRGGWARHRRGGNLFLKSDRAASADGLPALAEKFRDPVLADIQVVFAGDSRADAYPKHVTNLYANEPIDIWGVCPADQRELVFSMRGLNGPRVFENVFRLSFAAAPALTADAKREWAQRRLYAMVGAYAAAPNENLKRDLNLFAAHYGVAIPYAEELKK